MNKIILALIFVWFSITGFSQNEYADKIASYVKGYATAYKFNGAILVAKKNELFIKRLLVMQIRNGLFLTQ